MRRVISVLFALLFASVPGLAQAEDSIALPIVSTGATPVSLTITATLCDSTPVSGMLVAVDFVDGLARVEGQTDAQGSFTATGWSTGNVLYVYADSFWGVMYFLPLDGVHLDYCEDKVVATPAPPGSR
jgi:hypothetical protein